MSALYGNGQWFFTTIHKVTTTATPIKEKETISCKPLKQNQKLQKQQKQFSLTIVDISTVSQSIQSDYRTSILAINNLTILGYNDMFVSL